MKMRMSIVGIYDLGAESVELILRPGTGGDFSTNSREKGMPTIRLGADDGWSGVVTSLVHEAKEATEKRMGTRVCPDIDYGMDSGGYFFIESHAQHSEICGRVGYFLSQCWMDLSKAWKHWQKQAKKGKSKP